MLTRSNTSPRPRLPRPRPRPRSNRPRRAPIVSVVASIRRAVSRLTLAPLAPARGSGGWWPIVRESYTGAWQQNVTVTADTALSYFAVFACTTLIAGDVGKVRLRLVQQTADGIWE